MLHPFGCGILFGLFRLLINTNAVLERVGLTGPSAPLVRLHRHVEGALQSPGCAREAREP